MRVYSPVYSQVALDALLLASRSQRRAMRIALQKLCQEMPPVGDYQVRDESGRRWEVTLIDGVVITYWIDHPVCEVKIGLIESIE